MYTLTELKQVYKKSTKIKNSIQRSIVACNSTIYTEQNTEELNSVKSFLSYKLDLITDILAGVRNYLKNQTNQTIDEFSSMLQKQTSLFNEVSKDLHMHRLEQIYSRQINKEIADLQLN